MKGYMQWNPFTTGKISTSSREIKEQIYILQTSDLHLENAMILKLRNHATHMTAFIEKKHASIV
ncbi:MAG: hypothetical protein AB2693_01195 [Candidatus Thiodiazotropha sp.]